MIQLAMTPTQFARVRQILALPGSDMVSSSESGPNSGSFATSQVAMSYSYDGTSMLTLHVTEKHGLAKFASEDVIKARLVTLLATV